MVEITVKAADSASAMEEIEKRLGADAMIVSTNRVDGQIEIVATNDDPSKYQKTPEPLVLDKNYRIKGFSDVLSSKLSGEDKPLNNEISENHNEIEKNAENIKHADVKNDSKLPAKVETPKKLGQKTKSPDNNKKLHGKFLKRNIKKTSK